MDTPRKMTNGCCGDEFCNSGRRNRFFSRKRFTPDTWEVEQNYQQQRRHLINRAIHGWGVVFGFSVSAASDPGCGSLSAKYLELGSGLALDACGRELVWVGTHCAESQLVDLDEILALDSNGKLIPSQGKRGDLSPWHSGTAEACWLLRVHYAERLIAPVSTRDPCQCEQQDWDQVCETVRFSLKRLGSCDECCVESPCTLDCECGSSHCCPACSAEPAGRGGCRSLCDHLTKLDPTPDCCSLSKICDGLKVDLLNGVPLACVTLNRDECGDWTIGMVKDDCGPRRLVKRNDLLFDLIRGCDLTRISEVSWHGSHRKKIKFTDFKKMFGTADGKGAHVTHFSIGFSKPVQTDTITADAFALTVIARDDGEGWGRTLRIPVVGVQHDEVDGCHARGATVLVDSDWVSGALDDISVFAPQHVTRFEFRAYGDYLLDCNGLAVDANARGLCAAPTGNGVPGDTFVSTFLVEPMEPTDYNTPSSYEGM
ncbi:hypothetical protein [Paraburkholderia graminis]|uniref:hypothetical protein n=1 Tax=Paraburkholderia graminis TaxID=60548 RepID=UPI0038BC663E